MLSSVLRSDRAAEVNVAIIRTFVKLREILGHAQGSGAQSRGARPQIGALLSAVQKLLASPDPSKKYPIGCIHPKD
jgi:hypothetical protein